jgi:hypothetical protein
MDKPTLYKKRPIVDIMNRGVRPLNSDEQSQANTIINKFFQLFIETHT